MGIAHAAGLFLIIKALGDRDAFLRACSTAFAQNVDIAGSVQRGGQLCSDQPCRIEVSKQTLSPVLRYRDDTINLQLLQLQRRLLCEESCEGLDLNRRKRPLGGEQCLSQLVTVHSEANRRSKMQFSAATMYAAGLRR